ncbi:hypothetical protein TRVL_01657 [Trypanosoma vivax]|nr:hypothetical protein TRVL_01657 [Trypanosoma vivax]
MFMCLDFGRTRTCCVCCSRSPLFLLTATNATGHAQWSFGGCRRLSSFPLRERCLYITHEGALEMYNTLPLVVISHGLSRAYAGIFSISSSSPLKSLALV